MAGTALETEKEKLVRERRKWGLLGIGFMGLAVIDLVIGPVGITIIQGNTNLEPYATGIIIGWLISIFGLIGASLIAGDKTIKIAGKIDKLKKNV